MKSLTPEQIDKLHKMKEAGAWEHNGNIIYNRRVLLRVMFYYLKWRGKLYQPFKARFFYRENMTAIRRKPMYRDCPITTGQFRQAIGEAKKLGIINTRNEFSKGNAKSYKFIPDHAYVQRILNEVDNWA